VEGKNDEMLICVPHCTVLAVTAGTNLLVSVEKSKCWRQTAQGTKSEMDVLLLEVIYSTRCLCIRRSFAALSEKIYPDKVQWFPQS